MRRTRPTFERNAVRRSVLLYQSRQDSLVKSTLRSPSVSPRSNDSTFERRRKPTTSIRRSRCGVRPETSDGSSYSDSSEEDQDWTPPSTANRRISRARSFEQREALRVAAALAYVRGFQHFNSNRRRSSTHSSKIRHSVKSRKTRSVKRGSSAASLASDSEDAFEHIASELVNPSDSDGWSVRSVTADASSSTSGSPLSTKEFLMNNTETTTTSASIVDSAMSTGPTVVENEHITLQPIASSKVQGAPKAKPLFLSQIRNPPEGVQARDIKQKLSSDQAGTASQPTKPLQRQNSEPNIAGKANLFRSRSNSIDTNSGVLGPRRGVALKYITTPSFADLATKGTPNASSGTKRGAVEKPKLSPRLRLCRSFSDLSRATFDRMRNTALIFETSTSAESTASSPKNEPVSSCTPPLPPSSSDNQVDTALGQIAYVPEGLQECLSTPSPLSMDFQQKPNSWTQPRKRSFQKSKMMSQRSSSSGPDLSSENTTPSSSSSTSKETTSNTSRPRVSKARPHPPSVATNPAQQKRRASIIKRSTGNLSISLSLRSGGTSTPSPSASTVQAAAAPAPAPAPEVGRDSSPPPRTLEIGADPFARVDGGVEVVPTPSLAAVEHAHVRNASVKMRERGASDAQSRPRAWLDSSGGGGGNPLLASVPTAKAKAGRERRASDAQSRPRARLDSFGGGGNPLLASVPALNPLMAPLSAPEPPARPFALPQREERGQSASIFSGKEEEEKEKESSPRNSVASRPRISTGSGKVQGQGSYVVPAVLACPNPAVHRTRSIVGRSPICDDVPFGTPVACVAPWEHYSCQAITPDAPLSTDHSSRRPAYDTFRPPSSLTNQSKPPSEQRRRSASVLLASSVHQLKKISQQKANAVLDKAKSFSPLQTSEKVFHYEKFRERLEKERAGAGSVGKGAAAVVPTRTGPLWDTTPVFGQPMSPASPPAQPQPRMQVQVSRTSDGMFVTVPKLEFEILPLEREGEMRSSSSSSSLGKETALSPRWGGQLRKANAEESPRSSSSSSSVPTNSSRQRQHHYHQHRPSEPIIVQGSPTSILSRSSSGDRSAQKPSPLLLSASTTCSRTSSPFSSSSSSGAYVSPSRTSHHHRPSEPTIVQAPFTSILSRSSSVSNLLGRATPDSRTALVYVPPPSSSRRSSPRKTSPARRPNTADSEQRTFSTPFHFGPSHPSVRAEYPSQAGKGLVEVQHHTRPHAAHFPQGGDSLSSTVRGGDGSYDNF
ncbi:unnamed protein product [Tilletia caries]|nr:unnamed protein product [Tilletia caries]